MIPAAYYNEIDPAAAATLRELIRQGHIAPGDVDTRSIEDVPPDDLKPYTQCHFFAGFGVWSYALRLAGVPDTARVWTGSCPCQPFSAAGKGDGFADERHLWPAWHYLISQRRPAVVYGEQVASKTADPWVDLVHTDLEALDYAFGAVPFPSAGVGAPHIRDRTYWVAYAASQGPQGRQPSGQRPAVERGGEAGGLAHPHGRDSGAERQQRRGEYGQQPQDGGVSGVGDSDYVAQRTQSEICGGAHPNANRSIAPGHPGPTNGLWAAADWLLCRDGRWRPVEPGTFPLAHGAAARVGRLRGYGNAINAHAARIFIEETK
jgi:DNA (cytosine-5)-methyltransferase 1